MNDVFTPATLPVKLSEGLHLDPILAKSFGEQFANAYQNTAPYPHIVLDDFLPAALAERILEEFPAQPMAGDKHYAGGYTGAGKRQVSPIDCNEYLRNVFCFLNSSSMLQFLEGLTGIKGLISDPYFNGGGFP